MYLGRHQLGSRISLAIQCVNASGVPSLPDNPPLSRVFSTSALIQSKEMPIVDRYVVTGYFVLPLFLGTAFSAGHYTVEYLYRVGSDYGVAEDSFEVIAGGNVAGQVMNMYFYHRPHADFIVSGMDTGIIFPGRNPTVR